MATLFTYLLCMFMMYGVLNERLILVNKSTKERISTKDSVKAYVILELAKILCSITWIVAIPILLIQSLPDK